MATPMEQSPSAARSRRQVRQATLIDPSTGERLKRVITLGNHDLTNKATNVSTEGAPNGASNTPTAGGAANRTVNSSANTTENGAATSLGTAPNATTPSVPNESVLGKLSHLVSHLVSQAGTFVISAPQTAWKFVISRTGLDVLKCSVAYLVATMAVFIPQITRFIGKGDNQHLVASLIVWFHPARSEGSMNLGLLYATAAFIFSACVAYTSMAVSAFFGNRDLHLLGHCFVLVVAFGCGCGFIAWYKQYRGLPLISVSCSLAAIPITSLTKDPGIIGGYVNHDSIASILKMLFMAIVICLVINISINPRFARTELREHLSEITNAFAVVLAGVTSSFLSGSEDDMKQPDVLQANDKVETVYNALELNLDEAKFEHYLIGTEKSYHIEQRLVQCVQRLAQDIGGFRSASATQFSLLADAASPKAAESDTLPRTAGNTTFETNKTFATKPSPAGSESGSLHNFLESSSRATSIDQSSSATTAPQLFALFIDNLGPPLKSLAFTLKQILNDLPTKGNAPQDMSINTKYRSSLVSATDLFEHSSRDALVLVYQSKVAADAHSTGIRSDFEEVAASCGHFASSLQDLAQTCVIYLDILEELAVEIHKPYYRRTWWWLCFWRCESRPSEPETGLLGFEQANLSNENHLPTDLLHVGAKTAKDQAGSNAATMSKSFRYKLWKSLRVFERDDIRFAIKVGGGAIILASLAFIPSTKPIFYFFRLEWSLATYMLICAMTIGALNSGLYPRLRGTFIGAVLAILVWNVANNNPYALAGIGFVIAYACFFDNLVLGQAPGSRFVFLTYNLSVLYSYKLSRNEPKVNQDEGGTNPQIYTIVFHRLVAVCLGIFWGVFITEVIWPVSARHKLKSGISLLWLRMGLIWKRGPLSMLLHTDFQAPAYMQIGDETKLRQFTDKLQTLRKNAESEIMLRCPFQTDSYDILLKSTTRMLDSFHALNVVITKNQKATDGEKELLLYTIDERKQLAKRISHLYSVLASSVKLEYPLNDSLPEIEHTRDRMLAKIFEFRQNQLSHPAVTDEDYELLYTYALVTAQIAKEIDCLSKEIEKLYGTIEEDMLKLQ